jgi:hypothetical protein
MRSLKTIVLAISMLAPIAAAHAQGVGNPTGPRGSWFAVTHPRRNEVNHRIDYQRARINEGVATGRLSRGEAAQLRANDRAIKAQEHAEVRANGGYLTRGEQRQLNREENANSALIYGEKHGW